MIGLPPLSSALPVAAESAGWSKPWANWMTQAWRILAALSSSGTTANRPTANVYVGQFYFDTTLGRPIWAQSIGPIVWIKADGTIV